MTMVGSKNIHSAHHVFAAVLCRLLHQELESVSLSFESSFINCVDPQKTNNYTLPPASLNLQCFSMLLLWNSGHYQMTKPRPVYYTKKDVALAQPALSCQGAQMHEQAQLRKILPISLEPHSRPELMNSDKLSLF